MGISGVAEELLDFQEIFCYTLSDSFDPLRMVPEYTHKASPEQNISIIVHYNSFSQIFVN